ncbi:WbqC family protein [Streptomyces blastmyceticus]|uniref:WbqC-like protein n=1 Tax=Streptomyces blastmyceticus TaxID=68180 RepID=A0ABN0XU53_9ACTN
MPPTNPSSKTASTAVSSRSEPPRGGLCAIHQPNLFPRLTTLAKLFAADYWIVLDDVQFTRRDYQHRTRLAALEDPTRRQWLTVPTHLPRGRQTRIREAVMAEPGRSRERTARMLQQHYGASPHWPNFQHGLSAVLDRFASTDRTALVAEASTRLLLNMLGWPGQILRSSDLPARSGRSQRLADLTVAVGASTYLCGTGGMKYLEQSPFRTAGLSVLAFQAPVDDVWAFGHEVTALKPLMGSGEQTLAEALRSVSRKLTRGTSCPVRVSGGAVPCP